MSVLGQSIRNTVEGAIRKAHDRPKTVDAVKVLQLIRALAELSLVEGVDAKEGGHLPPFSLAAYRRTSMQMALELLKHFGAKTKVNAARQQQQEPDSNKPDDTQTDEKKKKKKSDLCEMVPPSSYQKKKKKKKKKNKEVNEFFVIR